jgi:hypothetical protein
MAKIRRENRKTLEGAVDLWMLEDAIISSMKPAAPDVA